MSTDPGFIYLASPYSHPDREYMRQRYRQTMAYTAYLLRERKWVYSPIVHCHELANNHAMPTDAAYWQDYNECMLRRADELYVLMLDRWRDSIGVAMEIKFWEEEMRRTPIFVSPLTR